MGPAKSPTERLADKHQEIYDFIRAFCLLVMGLRRKMELPGKKIVVKTERGEI